MKKNNNKQNISFKYIKEDLPASLVVFFVALPLCLGIAVASGASPFAGIISGVIGGVIVGYLSGSHVSVTGPAAGLIAILYAAITQMGYEPFLVSVILAGIFQAVLGFVKAGSIANYFPSGVIEGMLAAIGVIIIKKEIPHAIGYDKNHEGDFWELEKGADTGLFTEITNAIHYIHPGIIIVTVVSILILIAFTKIKALKKLKVLPGAFVVVFAGILINLLFEFLASKNLLDKDWVISGNHLVQLPQFKSFSEFTHSFVFPDFTAITNPKVWIVGLTIAAVASIETLLCIEAGDKLDPQKRYSSPDTELKAQGIGNVLSGLIGGIPMTSVIVRTSANINAGSKSKLSAMFHGLLLLLTVLAIPGLLNKIPMACLAAILIMTGLRLASPKLFIKLWKIGKHQFIPFLITFIAVVFTDLLKGVGIGLCVSVFYILKGNMKLAYYFKKEKHVEGEKIQIDLAQEVSFLNKAAIKQTLVHLPENSNVVINAEHTVYIDHDVLELISDFVHHNAKTKNIKVELINFKKEYKMNEFNYVH